MAAGGRELRVVVGGGGRRQLARAELPGWTRGACSCWFLQLAHATHNVVTLHSWRRGAPASFLPLLPPVRAAGIAPLYLWLPGLYRMGKWAAAGPSIGAHDILLCKQECSMSPTKPTTALLLLRVLVRISGSPAAAQCSTQLLCRCHPGCCRPPPLTVHSVLPLPLLPHQLPSHYSCLWQPLTRCTGCSGDAAARPQRSNAPPHAAPACFATISKGALCASATLPLFTRCTVCSACASPRC